MAPTLIMETSKIGKSQWCARELQVMKAMEAMEAKEQEHSGRGSYVPKGFRKLRGCRSLCD